ncbi:Hsp33 protein [Anaeromyxobacter dehalogenans 2CP-1]|uniref:Hsp33 protein n=1 Tax=Anaeromyxobacter dehalogenans (strain ATCC BAA-258 / DSM 21875 / 2CP-1) TaxID=455488 RepID=B8JAZ6_ANAD2|nr:Hsp33 family molecular chaperone HslO [Anaeromyxobacter dehalogenans]ACL63807.1 Hsp33 protein [Anaeromyxobacter dehalogenans 2CP-1]
MTDRLCRGLLPQRGLRAVFVRVGDTARMARVLHGLYPTSAHLFAQGLAAGALLGALQKEQGRVNLQIECDGPVGGIFVDADRDGNVRGYVRRPAVHFPGDPARAARAALGGSGFLSVLRDPGSGQYYRSAVELEALDVAEDLRRWFAASEQVETALDLAVVGREGEPLADVGGLLLQKLPDGDAAAVQAARERLASGALRAALARGAPAQEVIRDVAGDGFEVLADEEIAYRCGCSPERARAAVSALGREGIAQVLAEEKQAVISCEFCRQRYVIGEAELRDIARRLAERDAQDR